MTLEDAADLPHAVLREPLFCFCGSATRLVSNEVVYGRRLSDGSVWVCVRHPECEGYVKAHPDGTPMGSLCDAETRKLRSRVHALLDTRWKAKKRHGRRWGAARDKAYKRLAAAMRLTRDECHVGKFDARQCLQAIEILENEQ